MTPPAPWAAHSHVYHSFREEIPPGFTLKPPLVLIVTMCSCCLGQEADPHVATASFQGLQRAIREPLRRHFPGCTRPAPPVPMTTRQARGGRCSGGHFRVAPAVTWPAGADGAARPLPVSLGAPEGRPPAAAPGRSRRAGWGRGRGWVWGEDCARPLPATPALRAAPARHCPQPLTAAPARPC